MYLIEAKNNDVVTAEKELIGNSGKCGGEQPNSGGEKFQPP
jgi:hypothetical protein